MPTTNAPTAGLKNSNGSWCNTCKSGLGGSERRTDLGTEGDYLATLPLLDLDQYRNNPEACLILFKQQGFAHRSLRGDELPMILRMILAGKNEDLAMLQSVSTGSATDTRGPRASITIRGDHVIENELKVPGYDRAPTPQGKALLNALRQSIQSMGEAQRCTEVGAYGFTWDWSSMTEAQRRLLSGYIGFHCDQRSTDVGADGQPLHHTNRFVVFYGPRFRLKLRMILVRYERVQKDGKQTLSLRTRVICNFSIDMPKSGVYCLPPGCAGRHLIGAMRSPHAEDGNDLWGVCFEHATEPIAGGGGGDGPLNRTIWNFDFSSATPEGSARVRAAIMGGSLQFPDLPYDLPVDLDLTNSEAVGIFVENEISGRPSYDAERVLCRSCGGKASCFDRRGYDFGGEDVDDGGEDADDDGNNVDRDNVDGVAAPLVNGNGTVLELGAKITSIWSRQKKRKNRGSSLVPVTKEEGGAEYTGTITCLTPYAGLSDLIEVTYDEGGNKRSVVDHEVEHLYPSLVERTAQVSASSSSQVDAILPHLLCSFCAEANDTLISGENLVAPVCPSCFCNSPLGKLVYCGECVDYGKCIGFNNPAKSGERSYFCGREEGRTEGVVLDPFNINDYKGIARCMDCAKEYGRLQARDWRSTNKSKANDTSRGSVDYHRRLLGALDNPATKSGSKIWWGKVAEILEDDDKEKVKSAYKNTWAIKGRRKACGDRECDRCTAGTQCVIDLKTFEAFMEKFPDMKFGSDATAAANRKRTKSNYSKGS